MASSSRLLDPFDLMVFARVVDCGSLSAAAARLGLPKSTVSRRIASLERQLGEKVFQRTTRRIVLTEMGQRILLSAEQISQEVDGVRAVVEHRQATPSGRLRVSVPGDLAGISLAPMLARFSTDYPEVQLELDLSPRYIDILGEGFDLAIRIGNVAQDQRLAVRRLIDLSIGLYSAPAYLAARGAPLAPHDLVSHDLLVLMSSGTPVPWNLENDGRPWPITPTKRRISANSYELLFRLAVLGAGIAPIPDLFARPHVEARELTSVLAGWKLQPATVRAVFPSRQLMPKVTRVFLDSLLEFLKSLSKRDRRR